MADNKLTRQQIYDRIRETSRQDFILEEMKRLGFWKSNEREQAATELIIKKEGELQKELNKLISERQKFQNKEALLKEMRMKRMAETRIKREELKKKREKERYDRAEAWQRKKQTEILYLGEEVSIGLNNFIDKTDFLARHGLPSFANETALAQAMGLSVSELKFLAFNRKVSTVNHYQKFYLPKKSGGRRLISAPMPRLKKAQYWIFENILSKVRLHEAVHGFAPNKSIVTNAVPHLNKPLLINIDVKDFFPSVSFKRVKGLMRELGYSEKTAVILSLLCTEAVTEPVEIDGRKYFVQKGERVLPQGAPTSPVITNILCYKLDKRLQGIAGKLNCNYTRYADDISFSANDDRTDAQQLLWRIKRVVTDEGFTVHPEKIRVMRKGSRQEVTGVVVNDHLNIERSRLREFRALLHHIESGKADPSQINPVSILGYFNFIKMVNAPRAEKLRAKFPKAFAKLQA